LVLNHTFDDGELISTGGVRHGGLGLSVVKYSRLVTTYEDVDDRERRGTTELSERERNSSSGPRAFGIRHPGGYRNAEHASEGDLLLVDLRCKSLVRHGQTRIPG